MPPRTPAGRHRSDGPDRHLTGRVRNRVIKAATVEYRMLGCLRGRKVYDELAAFRRTVHRCQAADPA